MTPLRMVLVLLALVLLPWFGSALALAASSARIFGAGSGSTTWRTLTRLASNLSSNEATVSAEQLAFVQPPSTLMSCKAFLEMTRDAQSSLLERIAELQLVQKHVPVNFGRIQEFLELSSTMNGNPAAQFLHGALAEQQPAASINDPAKTLLFYDFASRGSSLPAMMALGYRYFYGYNTPRSCELAMHYYRHAADRVVVDQAASNVLLPSQMFALPQPVRLSDNHDHSDYRTHPKRGQNDLDRAEYLRNRALASRQPELMEQFASLALFSDLYCSSSSSRHLENDDKNGASMCTVRAKEAVELLQEAAKQGRYSAQALLGHVYAFSLAGVKQNVSRAIDLYEEALGMSRVAGAIAGEAANGLGLVYSYGLAGTSEANAHRAMEYFKLAADAGLADGVYNTAVMLMDSFPTSAHDYFAAAAQVGHLNSMYELARLKQRKLNKDDAESECQLIVELYKQVAEHGAEATGVLDLALAQFNAGAIEQSLSLYQIAAEMGSEVAQSNAAWIMERYSPLSSEEAYLLLVSRAADQNSADAYIRLGDWEFARGNHGTALEHYSEADYLSHGASGRALYSIGYMNEHGLGGALQSLERAALYYLFAGEAERVMWYPMAVLRFKLRTQIIVKQVLEIVSNAWLGLMAWLGTHQPDPRGESLSEMTSEALNVGDLRDIKADEAGTQIPSLATSGSSLSLPVEFASALKFSGPESQLDVELEMTQLLTESQDFTVETWLFVEENRPLTMMLVDALGNFQVELVPDVRIPHSWLIRFWKLSSLHPTQVGETTVFSEARLQDLTWYHIALTFEARTKTASLYINSKLCGQYLLQTQQARERSDQQVESTRLVAVGSSISPRVDGIQAEPFWGQLVRFRVWNVQILPEQITQLMLASEGKARAFVGDHLLIDLRYRLHGGSTGAPSSVLNGDRVLPMSSGVQLKMVRFPPAQQA